MKNDCKPDPRGPWPAGHPNEEEIRARIAHSLEEVPVAPTVTRGDLERLDKIITLFNAMAELFSDDMYDDAWNLRNSLVPFVPGDEHYDPAGEDEGDG